MLKVDTHHPQYVKMLPIWNKADAIVEGQTAVHEAGELYLPRLKEQSNDDYGAYKMRASFFNASGRTLDGLVGMIFRKEPVVEIPAGIQPIIDDLDMAGNGLGVFADMLTREVIKKSRIGVLVEYPQVTQQPKNLAEASTSNLRPYASVYKAKTIINWRVERVNNLSQPTMVALMEEYIKSDDGFAAECAPQIRVLKLEEGRYLQRIYRQDAGKKWMQFGGDIVPLKGNAPLNFIPFYVFGAQSNDLNEQMPVLLDLFDLNLAHYRTTADYEHGCHFAGLPTAVISGYEAKENEKLYIGSAAAWIFPLPDAKASYLEFTGQGLGALENNLAGKEKQMAAIGARFLEQQKNGVEAENTMRIRSAGENSVLAGIANMVSAQLSKMLTFMAEWQGINQECLIQLNTDFMPVTMNAQELTALVAAWQGGGISRETLFHNLQQGEVIAGDVSFADEQERIASAPVTLAE